MSAKDVSKAKPGSGHYLAKPGSGSGRGIMVLPAWWGLTPFFTGLCDRLAGQGFVALAPDLYHGATANTIEEAKKLRSKLKQEIATQEILQAVEVLGTECQEREAGIGVVGFSLGGYYGLWLADQTPSPVIAAVIFYGTRNGNYAKSRSAFQFHYAETDEYVAVSAINKLQKTLKLSGKETEFYTYPGTTHWFFESDRPQAYQRDAAETAWNRTVHFLRKNLG